MNVIAAGRMICVACGLKMDPLAQDQEEYISLKFHKECLICETCEAPLGDKKWCFLHKGVPYCDITCLRVKRQPKNSRCFACKVPVTGNTRVIKLCGHIYHRQCVRCSKCENRMGPGVPYHIKDKAIVCEKHTDNIEKKTKRSQIGEFQRNSLLHYARKHKYPNNLMRDTIAKNLDLNPKVVKVWFQNWRARHLKP